jgi:hypothetical protein
MLILRLVTATLGDGNQGLLFLDFETSFQLGPQNIRLI